MMKALSDRWPFVVFDAELKTFNPFLSMRDRYRIYSTAVRLLERNGPLPPQCFRWFHKAKKCLAGVSLIPR